MNLDKAQNLIHTELRVNNKIMTPIIDTGSSISLIDENLCKDLKLNIIPYSGNDFQAVNQTKINVIGITEIVIQTPGSDQITET